MRNRSLAFAALATVTLACGHGHAQPAAIDPAFGSWELIVATKEAPPFAMKQPDGTWRGISIGCPT